GRFPPKSGNSAPKSGNPAFKSGKPASMGEGRSSLEFKAGRSNSSGSSLPPVVGKSSPSLAGDDTRSGKSSIKRSSGSTVAGRSKESSSLATERSSSSSSASRLSSSSSWASSKPSESPGATPRIVRLGTGGGPFGAAAGGGELGIPSIVALRLSGGGRAASEASSPRAAPSTGGSEADGATT